MSESISKSSESQSFKLKDLLKVLPSFGKALEAAIKNKNSTFKEKMDVFFETFKREMGGVEKEKKEIIKKTEEKAEKVIKESSKIPTMESLTSAGQKALSTAMAVANDAYNKGLEGAKSCWDWVSKIYEKAGVKRKQVFSTLKQYIGKNCGNAHAGEAEYDSIKPGDHVFYNQQTEYDKEGKGKKSVDSQGNHSAIFVKWIDRDKKIAQVASGSNGTKWHIHKDPVDFNKMPVTRIFEPVEA